MGRRRREEEGGRQEGEEGNGREEGGGGKRVKVLRNGRRVTKYGKVNDMCRAGATLSAHEV